MRLGRAERREPCEHLQSRDDPRHILGREALQIPERAVHARGGEASIAMRANVQVGRNLGMMFLDDRLNGGSPRVTVSVGTVTCSGQMKRSRSNRLSSSQKPLRSQPRILGGCADGC